MASPTDPNPRPREVLLVALLLALATVAVMAPLFGVLSTHLPGDRGDGALNTWLLAWDADRLAHGLIGLWSPPIFYPYSDTLAYSENLIGIAVVVAPVQWLFDNPVVTYNAAFLLSFVVAGVSVYLLVVELTGSRTAAVVAAFGFAFAPYRWAQLSHLQVLWTAWLPLALWGLHRALRTSRRMWWGVFIIALLLQVFSNGYAAPQAALSSVLVVCAGAVRHGVDRVLLGRVAIAVFALGLLLLPAIVAHWHAWAAREPTPGDLVNNSADLGTYLDVAAELPHSKWLPGVAQNEGHLFPGVAIVLLALLAFAPLGRNRPAPPWRWLYAIMALLAVILSLGPEPRAWGHRLPIPPLYSWLVSTVPLSAAMRVPARFGMLAILATSVMAALGAARVTSRLHGKRAAALATALCALILWEGYGGPVHLHAHAPVKAHGDDAAYEWLASQPPGALLNLPMSTLGGKFVLNAQFASLRHGHPIVDGAGRMDTPLVEWLSGSSSPLVVPDLLPSAVPFLRALGVRYVFVRPSLFFSPAIAAQVVETFARDGKATERGRFGDVVAWELEQDVMEPDDTPELHRVAPEGLVLGASDNPDGLPRAIDGRPGTRWLSERPQVGSEWVTIDFDRPRDVAKVEFIVHPRSLIHFPRGLEVAASGRGASPETILFRGPVLREMGFGWKLAPEKPRVWIALPPHRMTRMHVRQLGRAPQFWAIDELVLWERD